MTHKLYVNVVLNGARVSYRPTPVDYCIVYFTRAKVLQAGEVPDKDIGYIGNKCCTQCKILNGGCKFYNNLMATAKKYCNNPTLSLLTKRQDINTIFILGEEVDNESNKEHNA